jgi:hypothetical protein
VSKFLQLTARKLFLLLRELPMLPLLLTSSLLLPWAQARAQDQDLSSSFSSSGAAATAVDYSCLHQASWLLNQNHEINPIFQKENEILSSFLSQNFWNISYLNGVLRYDHAIDPPTRQGEGEGKTKKKKIVVSYGEDVGLKGCHGYWPLDACPLIEEHTARYSLRPAPETNSHGGCFQNSLGSIGQFVNGAQLFSFLTPYGLSSSHEEEGKKVTEPESPVTWNTIRTPYLLSTLTDLCDGFVDEHGFYGHVFYPQCLAERLASVSSAASLSSAPVDHSPIYGWSRDNYPICGPYQVLSKRLLAQSSWKQREYYSECQRSAPLTGQREHDETARQRRICLLNDPYQPEKGVRDLESHLYGPSFDEAPLGSLFEDYFYDPITATSSSSLLSLSSSRGEEYLDEHNGHDHEPYGYHYHLTIDEKQQPVFPFAIGPQFYGCLSQSPLLEPTPDRTCCQTIHESRADTCPSLSSPSFSSICGQTSAKDRYDCSSSFSTASASTTSETQLPSPDLLLSSYSSHRQLIDTPATTLSPTLAPTVFQSPTFKPSLTFITQLPTTVTSAPSLFPSSNNQGQGNGGKDKIMSSSDIALIVLIVVGGLVVLASAGILIYWHLYTRTGPAAYADASSRTYTETIKDLTGINLVELGQERH